VLTLHGHAEPLAKALRRHGIHADPLAPDAQMELFP
jgi:hypothetical protein